MIQVSDPTELELQMRVNVDEFERVIPGQPVLVEVNRGSWAPGAVVAVSSRNQATDPTLRRDEYIAHLALEDSSIELRAQARLTARVIVESRPQTLVIPPPGCASSASAPTCACSKASCAARSTCASASAPTPRWRSLPAWSRANW